jgi:uncharacterized membrane protein
MKVPYLSIFHTLKSFGLDVILFTAGLAGGIAFLTKSDKLTRFQKFTTVLSGGFTANYLTPLVASWLNLSESTLYGLAFLLGYGGLKSVETLYSFFHDKFTPATRTVEIYKNETDGPDNLG